MKEKQALKRERENARYEQHEEGILQSLREKRCRAKSTVVPTTGEQTQSSTADEDCDWLHKNDTYQMQNIGGRMTPVNILSHKYVYKLHDCDGASIDDMDAAPVWVLNRAKEYFENDMIFIPINMDDVHCYLCVINARKLCVQVLDSLGPSMNRKDLTDTLEGPEDLFKYASEHMELKSNKWTDLSVTTWKREEYIKSSLQTDGPCLVIGFSI
ncbi:uncharacterized protein [Triticum aestivum]|uniref:uncharacterized protein isoform X1 n=1 Tax=Triticum aestivum TaxID=4565 RepID=UPI001D01203C|nr:uncharacterized protein LOC123149084 isoform X1 [Triticum aestivum]